MTTETGGPAFPLYSHGTQTLGLNVTGMTLRDYFAAKAMQGAISGCSSKGEVIMYSDLAGLSYEVADAMLKARTA